MNKIKSELGFTLIELLVVIFLIGLTTALVLPRGILQSVNSASLSSEATNLTSAIRLTRQKAINENSAIRVTFHQDSNLITDGYSVHASDSSAPDPPTNIMDNRIKLTFGLEGIPENGDTFIEYNSQGVTGQVGTIILEENIDSTRTKTLRIYSTGNIDISTP